MKKLLAVVMVLPLLVTLVQAADFDGDGTDDIAIFRSDNGLWAVRGVSRYYYGSSYDIPIGGDYNGDGTDDPVIFRSHVGLWAARYITRCYWGRTNDIPIGGCSGFVLSVVEVQGISDLVGATGDGKIGLAWTNPGLSDFYGVRVLRKTGSYPVNDGDGTVIYEGTGNNILDDNLTNNYTYFYAVIAYNDDGAHGGIGPDNRLEITPLEVSLSGENDPYADEVISFSPLSSGGSDSSAALGPPRGGGKYQGSLDVVSLHARVYDGTSPCGGSITLKFNDNLVWDGPGDDFTVFENVFYLNENENTRFMEPAIVAVSQDGKTYYTFPYDYVPHYYEDGSINYYNPYSYQEGFAGIHPVFSNDGTPDPTNPSISGGDSFDLSDITRKKLAWIQYIKITATGDGWLTDSNGDKVRHVQDLGACSGTGSSGFDLDAVSAVNY